MRHLAYFENFKIRPNGQIGIFNSVQNIVVAMTTTASSSPLVAPPASSLSPQIPNLPPPCSHPEVCCEEEWQKASETIGKTIFGLAWLDPDYLVGCTSAGTVLVWRLPEETDDDGTRNKRLKTSDEEGCIRDCKRPIVKFQASKGKLYNISFLDLGTSTVLGVCGDEGVKLFSWYDIETLMKKDGNDDDDSVVPPPEPLSQFQTHKSPTTIEINDFTYDDDYYLYGASGDAFGCYKWDMEAQTILKTYESSRGGYLHTVQALPASTTAGGHSVLLMGGEDGVLSVWDSKQDKLIEHIDIQETLKKQKGLVTTATTTTTSTTPTKKKSELSSSSSHLWTSHIVAPSSNWWNVCGGTESETGSSAGGYVSCWHAATRSLAAGSMTRETPNRMALLNGGTTLATVANEGVVSYWSPTSMKRDARVWCTPPCSYAIAVRESDGRTAVAGVGRTIDVLSSGGSKLYSLSI